MFYEKEKDVSIGLIAMLIVVAFTACGGGGGGGGVRNFTFHLPLAFGIHQHGTMQHGDRK